MKVIINNHTYIYSNNIRDTDSIWHSFNDLATKTFGLSFENWYQNGYWTDSYIPHVLMVDENVIANVSVNIMNCMLNDEEKRFIQLGTVMTDEAFRKQGLSAFLMRKVLEEWVHKCDGIYLYANDSVTDFYPQFGFEKSKEYQYQMHTVSGTGIAIQLNMDDKEDVSLLLKAYQHGNPFSTLSLIENEGLVMFYCSQFMKNNVYYCENHDAVVIAEFAGDTMTCYDIFGSCIGSMENILNAVAEPETKHIILGFTPKEPSEMQMVQIHEDNSTFFWHGTNQNTFEKEKMMFPLLSHA